MKERIRQLMDYEGLNAAQFAKKVSINTSVLSHLLVGRNNPSYDIVIKILENCPEVNVEWFMRGVGPMLKDGLSAPRQDLSTDTANYPDLFSTPQPQPPVRVPTTPENPKPLSNVRQQSEYRRENVARQPEIPTKPTEIQMNNVQNPVPHKISKILVFYTDNTFEEFRISAT